VSEFVVVCVDVRFLLSVRNVLDGGVSLVDGCLDVLQGDLGGAGVEVFYSFIHSLHCRDQAKKGS